MVPKADFECYQPLGIGNIGHTQDCSYTDVLEKVWRDRRFNLRGLHRPILAFEDCVQSPKIFTSLVVYTKSSTRRMRRLRTPDDMDICVAQAADIFGTGVVAGAFLMGSFAIHPAAAQLSGSSSVLLRQELIRRRARWSRSFMFLPVLASTPPFIAGI